METVDLGEASSPREAGAFSPVRPAFTRKEEQQEPAPYLRMREKQEVVYEVTEDPALLHQYYVLRREMYRRVHGFADFDAQPDEYDKISHIIVARRGKLCIGGVRLTVRERDERFLLPMETVAFRLKERLPEYKLHRHTHAEVSRFAVLEDFNTPQVLHQFYKALGEYASRMNVQYAFCRSPVSQARNWRLLSHRIGIYSAEILTHLSPPQVCHGDPRQEEHEEITMQLVVMERIHNVVSLAPDALRVPQGEVVH